MEIEFIHDMTVRAVNVNAADKLVVNAARVSYGSRAEDYDEQANAGLINYLLRNNHGSPFEHGLFTFYVEAPLFVAQQWMRHRAGHSYNQESGRYRVLEPRFYLPRSFRTQTGKPGAYQYNELTDNWDKCSNSIMEASHEAWQHYRTLLSEGVAREQARLVLPLNLMTKFYWTCNPRSLMHFLDLRTAPDAQQEIRDCAVMAETALAIYMPLTYAAWRAHK